MKNPVLNDISDKNTPESKNRQICKICDEIFKTRSLAIEHICKAHKVELGANDTILKLISPQFTI